MKIKLSSDIPVGRFMFDDYIELQSEQDFVPRRGQDSIAYGESTATGNQCTAYTDNSMAEGEFTQAGMWSFRIVSGDISANTWTLKTTEGIQPGYVYSVRLLNNYDVAGSVVSVLDENTISVDGFPRPKRVSELLSDPYLSGQPWYGELSASGVRAHPSPTNAKEYESHTGQTYPPEFCFYDFDFDANSMWFLGHPEIGDISVYATGAHSEGYMTQAGRQYSHAEGLSSITVGKYAHAEGWQTIAVWAAHSEGYMTSAFGQRSHAQGSNTLARGSGSLACGVKSIALGDNSFAYNGNSGKEYAVSGNGQFGINPTGGEWGFYIGDKPLGQMLLDVEPDVSRFEKALSTAGYEYIDVQFTVIPDMHINSNPDNQAGIGQPIPAKTSAYVCEYCGIPVQPGDEYQISTRLGGNTCIMLFERYAIPLSSYPDYMIKDSTATYKRFEIQIPDRCHYMTVDNYTNLTSHQEYISMSIKKKSRKFYEISKLDARIGALENEYSGVNQLVDEILN